MAIRAATGSAWRVWAAVPARLPLEVRHSALPPSLPVQLLRDCGTEHNSPHLFFRWYACWTEAQGRSDRSTVPHPHLQRTGPLPISRACRACQAARYVQTLRSTATPRRAPPSTAPSPLLAFTRSHAHYARDPDTAPVSPRPGQQAARPPPPQQQPPQDHELSEAARKATQAHSGPEGHQKEEHHPSATARNPEPVKPAAVADVGKATTVSDKEQSRRDWDIIKKLLPNVWPKNDWSTKRRVLLALGLLVGGKVRILCRNPFFSCACLTADMRRPFPHSS